MSDIYHISDDHSIHVVYPIISAEVAGLQLQLSRARCTARDGHLLNKGKMGDKLRENGGNMMRKSSN